MCQEQVVRLHFTLNVTILKEICQERMVRLHFPLNVENSKENELQKLNAVKIET